MTLELVHNEIKLKNNTFILPNLLSGVKSKLQKCYPVHMRKLFIKEIPRKEKGVIKMKTQKNMYQCVILRKETNFEKEKKRKE